MMSFSKELFNIVTICSRAYTHQKSSHGQQNGICYLTSKNVNFHQESQITLILDIFLYTLCNAIHEVTHSKYMRVTIDWIQIDQNTFMKSLKSQPPQLSRLSCVVNCYNSLVKHILEQAWAYAVQLPQGHIYLLQH